MSTQAMVMNSALALTIRINSMSCFSCFMALRVCQVSKLPGQTEKAVLRILRLT